MIITIVQISYLHIVILALQQEADMMGAPTTFLSVRYRVVDYAVPISIESNCALFKYPTLEPDITGFLKLLTFQVNIFVISIFRLYRFFQ